MSSCKYCRRPSESTSKETELLIFRYKEIQRYDEREKIITIIEVGDEVVSEHGHYHHVGQKVSQHLESNQVVDFLKVKGPITFEFCTNQPITVNLPNTQPMIELQFLTGRTSV